MAGRCLTRGVCPVRLQEREYSTADPLRLGVPEEVPSPLDQLKPEVIRVRLIAAKELEPDSAVGLTVEEQRRNV